MDIYTEITARKFWTWTGISLIAFGVLIFIIESNPPPPSQSPPQATAQTATPTPAQPTTFTDTQYWQQVQENVLPFVDAYGSDSKAIQTMGATSDTEDTSVYAIQAQSDLNNWKAGLQPLQGKVPPDYVSINSFLNEAANNYSIAISIVITDLNSNNTSDTSAAPYITQGNLDMQQATTAISQLSAKLNNQ